ncbi:MAG: hypothetical protein JNL60_09595 [Bacteroidia bacterium]|nr:hypothetical protein [Bacteroidia bacterium]
MKQLKLKLKGSSIVEVLVALAITSFGMVLASVIYLQLQKETLPFFKLKAVELAEQYMKKAVNEKGGFDESYKCEEFTVRRVVSPSTSFLDCLSVRIIVFDGSQKKLHELETVIYNGR